MNKRIVAAVAASIALFAATGCAPLNSGGTPSQSPGAAAGPEFDASSPFDVSTATVDGDEVQIDVGDGVTVSQDTSAPFRVAYLIQGTDNTWLQSHVRGAEDQASALGIELTVLDAGFDAQTQYAQYENALDSGEYDAFLVIAADSVGSCQILAETAPEEGILVAVVNQPLCGRGETVGLDAWAPGTLTTVIGTGSPDFYDAYAAWIGERMTEPTTVAHITGPAGNTSVEAQITSLHKEAEANPNFVFPYTAYTDFSSAGALAETQNLLAAHPEITAIVSNFTSLTIGVVEALKSVGREDVLVFDGGGSQQAVDLLAAGDIDASVAYFPYTASACGLDLLYRAHLGESVPRVVLNDCRGSDDDGATEQPTVVTPDDLSHFVPVF